MNKQIIEYVNTRSKKEKVLLLFLAKCFSYFYRIHGREELIWKDIWNHYIDGGFVDIKRAVGYLSAQRLYTELLKLKADPFLELEITKKKITSIKKKEEFDEMIEYLKKSEK